VAVNQDYAGRSFPATEPYEVSRVKIAEFANAIGDPNPVYRDRDAAVAAGYPDVIAPPTFPIVVTMAETIKTLGRNVVMTTRTEVRTVDGEQVCTAYSTLVERGTAGEAE
jgi:acyl dehydratase